MATVHICVLKLKSGGGSWGRGATPKEAERNAKKAGYVTRKDEVAETRFRKVDVPEGSELVVNELPTGVEWYTRTKA